MPKFKFGTQNISPDGCMTMWPCVEFVACPGCNLVFLYQEAGGIDSNTPTTEYKT